VESTAEYDLAWDLAAVVDPVLTAADRADIFAKIGAGETYGAIGHLLSSAQHLTYTLRPDLLMRAGVWLNAYAGSDEEPQLRAVISRLHAS
jgi:hypothetical protein